MNNLRRLVAVAGALAAAFPLAATAQSEVKQTRIVVGLAPGGLPDFAARLLAEKLRVILGRNVVVENKLGAGQRLALHDVRKAPPDGSAFLLVTSSPVTLFPHVYRNLDYKPLVDLVPVGKVMSFDSVIATGPMTGAKSLQQLVTWLKQNPSQASYGVPGSGTSVHMTGVAFSRAINVPLVHVPYKDSNLSMTDLIAGRIPMTVDGLNAARAELHKQGKLNVVAIAGSRRSPLLPEVPTLRELGVSVQGDVIVGMYAPAGTSKDIVSEFNRALVQALNMDDVKEKLLATGAHPSPSTPAEFAQTLKEESDMNRLLVEQSGFKPE